jgi:dolichol-phosphate mannosyltransferase
MKTWIVIPTYNEAGNIPLLVNGLLALPIHPLNILFVDDNSPDGSGAIADQLAGRAKDAVQCLHRPGKLGLGSAYRQGFQYALQKGAEAVVQMDADFSHPLDKIPGMLKLLGRYDIIIGSRYVPGGKLDERWSPFRRWLSSFGNSYARSILRLPILDITGGFKAWRRTALARMPLDTIRSNGYVFQVEMNYVAWRLGLTCTEMPIYFADRRHGRSKMNFRIQAEAALEVWRLPVRHRDLPRRIIPRERSKDR